MTLPIDLRSLMKEAILFAFSEQELQDKFLTEEELDTLSAVDFLELYDEALVHEGTD